MRSLVIVFLLITLSGCASGFRVMNKGLDCLLGESEEALFQALGYPDNYHKFDDHRTLYLWNTNYNETYQTINYETTTGYVGDVPYSVTEPTYETHTDNYFCTIKVMVQEQTVVGYDYSGNRGGCRPYIKNLKRYLKRHRR